MVVVVAGVVAVVAAAAAAGFLAVVAAAAVVAAVATSVGRHRFAELWEYLFQESFRSFLCQHPRLP